MTQAHTRGVLLWSPNPRHLFFSGLPQAALPLSLAAECESKRLKSESMN